MQDCVRTSLGKWEFLLAAALLVLFTDTSANAGRNNLKPTDFVPLTSLPWKEPDAKLESVLERIFREPNYEIRSGVLAEYLQIIPVAHLGRAFDQCIALEGAQSPDGLIDLFLRIWAKRDPEVCWKRMRQLFRVVGIDGGWLSYDSWSNERITVTDRSAIEASPFWIEDHYVLTSFAEGVEESSLSKANRVRLMKEFANVWFDTFASWPGSSRNDSQRQGDTRHLMEMFELSSEVVRGDSFFESGYMSGDYLHARLAFIVGARRRLKEMPEDALKIVQKVRDKIWQPTRGGNDSRSSEPSKELLTIWADVDFAAMLRWAESLDPRKDPVGVTARGLLLSRVDQDKRDRWLKHAQPVNEGDGYFASLLEEWAGWDPKNALDVAVGTGDPDTITSVAFRGVYGPFADQPWNSSHFGMGVIKAFNVAGLPDDVRNQVISEWGITIMEQWGDIDIGEAARYGLDFMLRNDYAPRENLIKLFSGDDKFSSDSDMIDRTFCALRVWAVVKPREMRAWIGTIKEADMRKALTWLLEHPWGTGRKE